MSRKKPANNAKNKGPGPAIGARVRTLREQAGMTPTVLARKITALGHPCAIQNITQLELGKIKNRPMYLPELAIALETTAEWLLTGDAQPQAAPTIDAARLARAWHEANTVIDEHKLDLPDDRRIELAVAIYHRTQPGAGSIPRAASKEALLDLLIRDRRG